MAYDTWRYIYPVSNGPIFTRACPILLSHPRIFVLFKHQYTFFNRAECLVSRISRGYAERHLCNEPPRLAYIPFPVYGIVYQRIVVLQRSPKSGIFEHGPNSKLMHGRRVLRPIAEILAVKRIVMLQLLHHRLVLKKQHCAISRSEAFVNLCLCPAESLWRHYSPERIINVFPYTQARLPGLSGTF